MKNISLLIISLLLAFTGIAQVPDAINFQAIARDAEGEVMSNTDIMIQLTILEGGPEGTQVYREIRSLTTNDYGSFSFQIARDPFMSEGDFSEIVWETGEKYMKIDYDPTASLNFDLTLGTIEFVTVPYAFAAGAVAYIDMTGVQDGDVLIYNSTTEKFEPGQMTASSVEWDDILNIPNFATVATSGNYNDLLNLPDFTGWDTNTSDDFDGLWNSLTGTVPNISIFNNNAGYLTSLSETDPIFTDWDKTTGISITESQISDFGTYLTTENDPAFDIFNITTPADGELLKYDNSSGKWQNFTPNYLTSFTEVDGSITNETITNLNLNGTSLEITEAGSLKSIDLFDLTNMQTLTSPNGSEYEVFVDNNGQIYTVPISVVSYITIIAPGNGTEWEKGTLKNITWSDNISGNVKIELYKAGSLNTEIISSTESDGNYSWEVLSSLNEGTDYTIKITSIDDTQIFGETSNFSITPAPNTINFDDGQLPADWSVSGAGWFVNGDGKLQSGEYNIGDIATVTTTQTFAQDGKLSFDLSNANNGGIITFYIDNYKIRDWESRANLETYVIFIPAGTHTFKWETERTASSSVVEATQIDLVTFADGDNELAIGLYYQGGIIFDLNTNKTHGLITSNNDLSYNDNYTLNWGCDGSEITSGNGADSDNDGSANTQAIITDCTEDGIAAKVCSDYSFETFSINYTDWYLPSKNELNILYNNKNWINGLSSEYYWSSTEYDNDAAWIQEFDSGQQGESMMKTNYLNIGSRAVRVF